MRVIKLPSQFLGEKFGGPYEGYVGLFEKQKKRTHFFAYGEIEKLDALVADLAPKSDLYLALGTQKDRLPPMKRGKAETVKMVPGFLADIDFASAKPNSRKYPPDEPTALQILREFSLAPTTLVRTGNGLHAHWDLEKPLVLDGAQDWQIARALWRAFQSEVQQRFAAHGYEIDSIGDLTRLYRIPGTYNHKCNPAKRVEVIGHD